MKDFLINTLAFITAILFSIGFCYVFTKLDEPTQIKPKNVKFDGCRWINFPNGEWKHSPNCDNMHHIIEEHEED